MHYTDKNSLISKELILNEIICVCCSKDLETWKTSSGFIAKNITANSYIVIVPDSEVNLFSKCSDPAFLIAPESRYIKASKQWVADHLPDHKKNNAGWYFQQLLKISAAKTGSQKDYRLIWDADTVPLKKLNFFSPNGKLIFYKGTEMHAPYFISIQKLLGLERTANFSFIAQCLAFRSDWVQDLCSEIELKAGENWIDAIINSLDLSKENGFSEYETLGTYFMHHHRDDMLISDQEWYRYGGSMIGNISRLTTKKATQLSSKYDYIAFESWDVATGLAKLKQQIPFAIIFFIHTINRWINK